MVAVLPVLAVLATLAEAALGVDAGWLDTRACSNDWVKLCRSWAIWPRLLTAADEAQINQDLPVLENFDVLSDFGALTDLPQPVQPDDAGDSNTDQNQNQKQDDNQNQTM